MRREVRTMKQVSRIRPARGLLAILRSVTGMIDRSLGTHYLSPLAVYGARAGWAHKINVYDTCLRQTSIASVPPAYEREETCNSRTLFGLPHASFVCSSRAPLR